MIGSAVSGCVLPRKVIGRHTLDQALRIRRITAGIVSSPHRPIESGGARWGLAGVEAVLKLRTVVANGSHSEYWRFHLDENTTEFTTPTTKRTPWTISRASLGA